MATGGILGMEKASSQGPSCNSLSNSLSLSRIVRVTPFKARCMIWCSSGRSKLSESLRWKGNKFFCFCMVVIWDRDRGFCFNILLSHLFGNVCLFGLRGVFTDFIVARLRIAKAFLVVLGEAGVASNLLPVSGVEACKPRPQLQLILQSHVAARFSLLLIDKEQSNHPGLFWGESLQRSRLRPKAVAPGAHPQHTHSIFSLLPS